METVAMLDVKKAQNQFQNRKDTHTLHKQTISTLTSTPIHTPTHAETTLKSTTPTASYTHTHTHTSTITKKWANPNYGHIHATRPFSRLTRCDKHPLNQLVCVFGLKENHLHPVCEHCRGKQRLSLNMQQCDYSTRHDLSGACYYRISQLRHHPDLQKMHHLQNKKWQLTFMTWEDKEYVSTPSTELV